jgi:FtsZ-interacting cell division protein ZipA
MHCSRKHLAEELNNANGTVEDDTMDIMEDQTLMHYVTCMEGITKGNVKSI